MIVTLFVGYMFALVTFVISFVITLIPSTFFVNHDISGIFDLLLIAGLFVPSGMVFTLITSIVFWYISRVGWAVVEWVYKKIPGID